MARRQEMIKVTQLTLVHYMESLETIFSLPKTKQSYSGISTRTPCMPWIQRSPMVGLVLTQ